MRNRLGLFFIILGFVELTLTFGWIYMVNNHEWTDPVTTSVQDLSTFSFLALILTICSPFMFIIIGSMLLETGDYKLLKRKQQGLCWKCGTNIKDVPRFKCPFCGNEHDTEITQLYIDIGLRQQKLRELGDG